VTLFVLLRAGLRVRLVRAGLLDGVRERLLGGLLVALGRRVDLVVVPGLHEHIGDARVGDLDDAGERDDPGVLGLLQRPRRAG
jgi:hypothetical protein